MAIADGMSISCSDLQAVGGTRLIAIRVVTSNDTVTFDDATHGINVIKSSTGTATEANWGVYESRIESSSLTITGSNEGKDNTAYECNVSWFIPGMTASQFLRLHQFEGDCLMVMVIDNNDNTSGATPAALTYASNKVIGTSKRFNDLDNQGRSQTYARVISIEGGTGAAFSDEIGVTVTIGCTQYEIPRKYEGTIELGSTGKTLTTSA
jgi:hypothetical protein